MKLPKNFEKIVILKIGEMSKLTSVRNKLNLSMKYWFMEAKIVFFTCLGPPKRVKIPSRDSADYI